MINPATEKALTSVADGQSEDWMKAPDLTDTAFSSFAALAPRERFTILYEIFWAVRIGRRTLPN